MRRARSYLFDTMCTQHFSSTSFDPSFFSVVPTQEILSLFYECNESPILSRAETVFSCDTNGASNNDSFFLFDSDSSIPSPTSFDIHCNTSVNVPIFITWSHQVGAKRSLLEVFRYGFNVSYNNPYAPKYDVCVKSGGQFGFDVELGKPICICGDRLCPESNSTKTTLAVALSIAVFTTIVISILLIFFTRKEKLSSGFWRSANSNGKIETFIMIHESLVPKRFSFSEIKKMTNMFNNKLGEGGFGSVYKGKLQDGRLVAVKVLSKSKTEGEELINEVASISKTSHKNIVALLGFGYEGNKRALVYEYMPNGSLDKYIYREKSSYTTHHLEWEALYEIAIGIARGLEYLHLRCNTRIVHFDIKPHNILLDEKFCPKISDFGLAKLCKSEESRVSMTGARGTAGYIAPEVFCRKFGGVSCKSDVYRYGMMVLEIVGGRRNVEVGLSNTNEVYFPDYVYDRLQDGNTIFEQEVITNEVEETMQKMVLVGLWCIQFNPSDRPSMTKVVEMLKGSLQSLQLPPKSFSFSPKTLFDA